MLLEKIVAEMKAKVYGVHSQYGVDFFGVQSLIYLFSVFERSHKHTLKCVVVFL